MPAPPASALTRKRGGPNGIEKSRSTPIIAVKFHAGQASLLQCTITITTLASLASSRIDTIRHGPAPRKSRSAAHQSSGRHSELLGTAHNILHRHRNKLCSDGSIRRNNDVQLIEADISRREAGIEHLCKHSGDRNRRGHNRRVRSRCRFTVSLRRCQRTEADGVDDNRLTRRNWMIDIGKLVIAPVLDAGQACAANEDPRLRA